MYRTHAVINTFRVCKIWVKKVVSETTLGLIGPIYFNISKNKQYDFKNQQEKMPDKKLLLL